jgi:hypothetical protein
MVMVIENEPNQLNRAVVTAERLDTTLEHATLVQKSLPNQYKLNVRRLFV